MKDDEFYIQLSDIKESFGNETWLHESINQMLCKNKSIFVTFSESGLVVATTSYILKKYYSFDNHFVCFFFYSRMAERGNSTNIFFFLFGKHNEGYWTSFPTVRNNSRLWKCKHDFKRASTK